MAVELIAEKRDIFGKKVKNLRRQGIVPAEVYGREADNMSIQLDEKQLRIALREAGGTSLISLKIDGGSSVNVLARNLQFSPVKRSLLHVDFYTVIMTEKVTVSVPIHLIGESPLVIDEGGTMVSGLSTLDIEALPAEIPETIEVDISSLTEFTHAIAVSDLDLPEGVTVLSSLDSMVATVQPPRLASELEELDSDVGEAVEAVELDEDEEEEAAEEEE